MDYSPSGGISDMVKLIIRGLPPTMGKADFVRALRHAFPDSAGAHAETTTSGNDSGMSDTIGDVQWIAYIQGKHGSQRVKCSHAYVAVAGVNHVAAVHTAMDGRLFVSEKGAQYRSTVEYAPSQRIPRDTSVEMAMGAADNDEDAVAKALEAAIEDDDDYKQLVENRRSGTRANVNGVTTTCGLHVSHGATDAGAFGSALTDSLDSSSSSSKGTYAAAAIASASRAPDRPTPLVQFLLSKKEREKASKKSSGGVEVTLRRTSAKSKSAGGASANNSNSSSSNNNNNKKKKSSTKSNKNRAKESEKSPRKGKKKSGGDGDADATGSSGGGATKGDKKQKQQQQQQQKKQKQKQKQSNESGSNKATHQEVFAPRVLRKDPPSQTDRAESSKNHNAQPSQQQPKPQSQQQQQQQPQQSQSNTTKQHKQNQRGRRRKGGGFGGGGGTTTAPSSQPPI